MSDLISRRAAIDALMEKDKKLRNLNWYDKPYAEGECRGIDEALSIISNLPSAQPEPEWGLPVSINRPLSDREIIPRLREIQRQIPGGSYAIDRAIELIKASVFLKEIRGKSTP